MTLKRFQPVIFTVDLPKEMTGRFKLFERTRIGFPTLTPVEYS
jgi:hypothetical protein